MGDSAGVQGISKLFFAQLNKHNVRGNVLNDVQIPLDRVIINAMENNGEFISLTVGDCSRDHARGQTSPRRNLETTPQDSLFTWHVKAGIQ